MNGHDLLGNLAQVLGAVQSSSGSAGHTQLWGQVKPWIAKLTTQGAVKWLPSAALNLPCQVPFFFDGRPVSPCTHTAVGHCLACKRPTCLEHAFVDSNGEMFCYLCVVARLQSLDGPKGPDPRIEAEKTLFWARGVLGVEEGATQDEIRAAHRKLSGILHPDRMGGDEKRFKDVQKAYDLLKEK